MREYELQEGMRRTDGLTQKSFFQGLYWHIRDQIDPYMKWSDLRETIAEVKSKLVYPLKVYRGLYLELSADEYEHFLSKMDYDFDAHNDAHCPSDLAETLVSKINWQRVGTSWTWNRKSAVHGGKLDNMNHTNVILEAEVTSRDVDLLVTLWQNLTVYQEEEEVRLFANRPLKITGIAPSNCGIGLPIRANTGPESWDSRDSVLSDLAAAFKDRKQP